MLLDNADKSPSLLDGLFGRGLKREEQCKDGAVSPRALRAADTKPAAMAIHYLLADP